MEPYHYRTIYQLFSARVSSSPTHPFLIFGNLSYTYAEFDRTTTSLAATLSLRGIHSGDHVALFLPNCPEFLLSWFALVKIGAVMVPLNPTYQAGELATLLAHSDSKLLITNATLSPRAPANFPLLLAQDMPAQSSDFVPTPSTNPEDLASILYTSGTTGTPKGVMLPHRSYTIGGESFAFRAQLTSFDRQLVFLPLFHVNAEIYSVMGALVAGSTLVLLDSFHSSSFWSTIVKQEITQFNFLGVIANILLKADSIPEETAHHVRLACGAGLSESTIRAFRARFRIPLLETYGLTEAPMGLSNTLADLKEGSIGKPSRHPDPNIFTEVKLVDDEIVLRTPAQALGYWQNPEESKQAFRDGWFYTGDLGRLDSDGYYYFVDRRKDIIRKKGENISSRELELVIAQHPAVSEVAVIPIPSPLGEDDIKAYVVQKSDSLLTLLDLRLHCQTHLSPQKTPALIEFVPTLPKTPTNKIAKNELKQLFVKTQAKRLQPRAFLVDGIRTPIAKVDQGYKDLRPDELLASTLSALAERTGITTADDLLVGCVNQGGEGERNLARQALLLSTLSPSTPATTVTRLSASSLEATRLGFASLASGLAETTLIGGVESFSHTPTTDRLGYPHLHPSLKEILLPSGEFIAEMAAHDQLSRSAQDEYTYSSNERALAAQSHLSSHLLPTAGLSQDAIPRSGLTLARLRELPPLYGETITAGNSSKLGDAAGALLLATPLSVSSHAWQPLAGLVGFSLVAGSPADYGRLPVTAIRQLLNAHDLTLDHIGVWEIHEAYAATALYAARELKLRPDRINKWGGAISLGHPFGATGIRMLLSAAHQLQTADPPYAVVAICIGGGQALACLLSKPERS